MEAIADCEGALKFRLDAESSQKGIEAGPQCEWLYAAEGQIWLECGIQLLEAKCILRCLSSPAVYCAHAVSFISHWRRTDAGVVIPGLSYIRGLYSLYAIT